MYVQYQSPIIGRISEKFERAYQSISLTIDQENENYILNVNETDYIEHISSQHELSTPEIHFDQKYADSYEDFVPSEYLPGFWHVEDGKKHKMEIIQFFIPVSGDISLLKYSPSAVIYSSGGGYYKIQGDTLLIEFLNLSNNPDEIKQNYQSKEEAIRKNFIILKKEIEEFNNSLNDHIFGKLRQRKEKFLNKHNLLSALGVPLKEKENVPSTFNVPKPRQPKRLGWIT